ncbi:DUF2851 family protein [Winogradskyella sp. A3E31]|uniref:DUF2851 family protein n=1 Tax=Winogradskyella sp. A3E31 TaxID=3349637 RepID=UPI00398B34D2
MQEAFLHYIWKFQKLDSTKLITTNGKAIQVNNVGQHNSNAGPDFFNAQVLIGKQLWAGNVEIHIKSSDWYVHGHEKDKAYDNVILHVVWEHDTDIFRADNSVIDTLVLEPYVSKSILNSYNHLMSNEQRWINCENDFPDIDDFTISNWLERLYIERLERKSIEIEDLLTNSNNDWEAVLFKMLTKNFGLKVNGKPFMSLAESIDFSVVRKTKTELLDLEALLFGQTGLLTEDVENSYYVDLQKRYDYLRQKFKLNNRGVLPLQFFRLRPPNFPTIRLSQLANVFHKHSNLFSKIIAMSKLDEFYTLFNIETSEFWKTHYTFSKTSKKSAKKLTKPFIDLLIINTIIPIKFSYSKSRGEKIEDHILELIKSIKIENNSITNTFLELKPLEKSALTSQSLIQLKTEYCDKNKCLLCAVGNQLILKK